MYGFFIAITITAKALGYTSIIDSMYRQSLITYVLGLQFLICCFPVEKWRNRLTAVWSLFPIIVLSTFTAISLELHYFHSFTIALWFLTAGYALGMNEKLRQSFSEFYNLLTCEGIIETIEHVYSKRRLGSIFKVFWLIMFVHIVVSANDNLEERTSLWIYATCCSILQYFSLSLLILDGTFIILWIVEAFLKWSVRHRISDEIEIGEYGNRMKVKAIVIPIFGICCVNSLSVLYFTNDNKSRERLYLSAAVIYSVICCTVIFRLALLLCDETLQALSTSLWGSFWRHVRAILLTIFLFCTFIYASWNISEDLKLYLLYWMVETLIRTMKTSAIYVLHLYDFLSSNGIEQVEEKVYKLHLIVDIVMVLYAIYLGIFILATWDFLKIGGLSKYIMYFKFYVDNVHLKFGAYIVLSVFWHACYWHQILSIHC